MSILNRINTDRSNYIQLSSQLGHIVATMGKEEAHINQAKQWLNEIFPNTKCVHFIVTPNIDKQFFGLRVYPIMDASQVLEFLDRDHFYNPDEPTFAKYNVELDSKLIDGTITLLDDELMSLVTHFVYHVVYGGEHKTEICNAITCRSDSCCCMSNLKSNRSMQELVGYGLKDAIMKCANPLYELDGSKIVEDEFLKAAGLCQESYSALRTIVAAIPFLQCYADDRFIALAWALRVVDDYEHLRGPAYKTLMKASQLTGSKLESDMLSSTAKIIFTVNSINESCDPRYNMVPEHPREEPLELKPYKDDAFYAHAILNRADIDSVAVMECWSKANEAIADLEQWLNECDGYETHPTYPGRLGMYDRESYEAVLNDWYSIRDRCKELKEKFMDRNDGRIPETFINI